MNKDNMWHDEVVEWLDKVCEANHKKASADKWLWYSLTQLHMYMDDYINKEKELTAKRLEETNNESTND